MRILLTGAFGNIGSHTLPELLAPRPPGALPGPPHHRQPPPAARSSGVETVWGDLTDPDAVAAGGRRRRHGHPPGRDDPARRRRAARTLARKTNVDGTANVIAACLAQPAPPRLLFTSTFDVHGHTLHQAAAPPRRRPAGGDQPVHRAQDRVRGPDPGVRPGLVHPPPGRRADPRHRATRIRSCSRSAWTTGSSRCTPTTPGSPSPTRWTRRQVWGRVLFVGGGPSCQLTYREYLTRLLAAMGIEPVARRRVQRRRSTPPTGSTPTDSEALLHYQRHTFDDIAEAVAASLGWKRQLAVGRQPAGPGRDPAPVALPPAAPVRRTAPL